MTDIIKSTGKSIGSAVIQLKKDGLLASKDSSDGYNVQKGETFRVDFNLLFIEKDFNIRELDDEHVNNFAHAYTNGDHVPALVVEPVTVNDELRFKIIDGHHRYNGAAKAIKNGADIKNLPVVEFVGNNVDKVILMITSSQGRALTFLERAKAYQRLVSMGYSNKDLAARLNVTSAIISNALKLLKADKAILDHVASENISGSRVVSLMRTHATIDDAMKAAMSEVSLKLANDEIGAENLTAKSEPEITKHVKLEHVTDAGTDDLPKPEKAQKLKIKKASPKLVDEVVEAFNSLDRIMQAALLIAPSQDENIKVEISRSDIFKYMAIQADLDEIKRHNENVEKKIAELQNK